jgi:hypothetical protein
MSDAAAAAARQSLMRVLRADSTLHSHLRLAISTLLQLQPFPLVTDVFNLCFHPVSLVELAGYVVRRVIRRARVEFTLDDGTGLLSCTHWDADPESTTTTTSSTAPEVHVGTFVRLHGKLKLFRGALTLTVYRLVREDRPDAQALVWLEQVLAARQMYAVVDRAQKDRILAICNASAPSRDANDNSNNNNDDDDSMTAL